MGSVHFIGGEKGGVGKSTLARLLSQYFIDRDQRHVAFDADQSHATLTRHYADFTQAVALDDFESTDSIMEQAIDLDAAVVVDLPAQSQRHLDQWIEDSGVLELCEETGVPLIYWYVVDGGPDSVQLLGNFLDKYAGVLKPVVVCNHGCGTDFSDIHAVMQKREESAQQALIRIELPALHAGTMHKIEKMNLSFWAAINLKDKGTQHLGMMERQRAKVWLKKAYAAFDNGLSTAEGGS